MLLEQLEKEIVAITGADVTTKREALVDAIVHTPSGNYQIFTFPHIDIIKDYNNAYSDNINVEIGMLLGDFLKDVYPNRDRLEITLKIHTIGKLYTLRLKFILGEIPDVITHRKFDKNNEEELQRELVMFKGQCIDRYILKMREKTTYGIFKKATVADVLQSLFYKELGLISSVFGFLPTGLKIIPPNNTRVYEHIIIPSGTALLSLPNYLQEHYGVYNGHIGIYKSQLGEDTNLLIYPIYRNNLLSFIKKKLKIIVSPDIMSASTNATYVQENNSLKILVGHVDIPDDDDTAVRDKGTAIRATEATAVTRRPVEITQDSVKVTSNNVNRSIAHRETPDGLGPIKNAGVDSNLYKERTKVLASDGTFVTLKWNNSNASLLLPLMPVILTYVNDDGRVKQREGILHKIHYYIDNGSKTETAILTIFLKHLKDKQNASNLIATKIF